MIKLKRIIKYGVFSYYQVKKGKQALIYSQYNNGMLYGFEVFKLKTKPDRFLKGKYLPANERFPDDKAFGYWAWSPWTYERALVKFKELEKNEEICITV